MLKQLVLKRCISGLPKNECPRIPKTILEQARSYRYKRSITQNDTDSSFDRIKRSPIQFPDSLIPLSQTEVNESPVVCEERRQLGAQILIEKGHYADSMLSRFVGNFIMIFSNQTTAQEVSKVHVMFCLLFFVGIIRAAWETLKRLLY